MWVNLGVCGKASEGPVEDLSSDVNLWVSQGGGVTYVIRLRNVSAQPFGWDVCNCFVKFNACNSVTMLGQVVTYTGED